MKILTGDDIPRFSIKIVDNFGKERIFGIDHYRYDGEIRAITLEVFDHGFEHAVDGVIERNITWAVIGLFNNISGYWTGEVEDES